MPPNTEITLLLRRWGAGDEAAFDQLFPLVYSRLKEIAHNRLGKEYQHASLNTTALVHEAYLKMAGIDSVEWQDREHFMALASKVMRQVLVDYARNRNAEKRGGGKAVFEWLDGQMIPDAEAETILDLHLALEKMEVSWPRQSKAVEHHYFGGFTLQEIGETLGTSAPTVMRDLRFAHAWLAREWAGR